MEYIKKDKNIVFWKWEIIWGNFRRKVKGNFRVIVVQKLDSKWFRLEEGKRGFQGDSFIKKRNRIIGYLVIQIVLRGVYSCVGEFVDELVIYKQKIE